MSTCYLIDFENVHDQGLWGIDKLNYDDCVFIFYTVQANKVSLNSLEGIQAALRVIQTPDGNQSLDRHLISYLGFLLGQESDPETRYYVISNDNGYRKIIEFWNNLLDTVGKIKQRSCIRCQGGMSVPVPYFTPDGQVLSKSAIQLRRAIIRHMRNHGEKSLNGHWFMSVSDLCGYLNNQKCYHDARVMSGKKPMAFLTEDLDDILIIRREHNTDLAYLVSEREYWEFPETRQSDATFEPVESVTDNEMVEPLDSLAEVAVSEFAEVAEQVSGSEKSYQEIDVRDATESTVRQIFDTEAEDDGSGRKRVRASLLRDRLGMFEAYRRAQSLSGMKPLEYLAEALSNIILIRVEKGRSWAYLADEEEPEMDMTSNDLEIPDAIDFPATTVEEEIPKLPVPQSETMGADEKAIFEKLTFSGKETQIASIIAASAATALLSEQPRAEFHTRLWQNFGQKLGTRYYRETVELLEERVSSTI